MRIENDESTAAGLATLERKIDDLGREVAAIRRHFLWERVIGIIKTLLIAVPLIWGFVALYPMVSKLYAQVESVVGQANGLINLTK
jgi:hypothetical protein